MQFGVGRALLAWCSVTLLLLEILKYCACLSSLLSADNIIFIRSLLKHNVPSNCLQSLDQLCKAQV